MLDIKTGVSGLALWKGYCDKKIQCEKLTEENAQLKADKVELLKALNGVMNIVAVSTGIDGYHCNGDTACWWDFDEIAEVSELIQKHKEQNNE